MTPSTTFHDGDHNCDCMGSERLLVPKCSADWEAKKAIIKELYIDQNLILNDVINIMQSAHHFKATYVLEEESL